MRHSEENSRPRHDNRGLQRLWRKRVRTYSWWGPYCDLQTRQEEGTILYQMISHVDPNATIEIGIGEPDNLEGDDLLTLTL